MQYQLSPLLGDIGVKLDNDFNPMLDVEN